MIIDYEFLIFLNFNIKGKLLFRTFYRIFKLYYGRAHKMFYQY